MAAAEFALLQRWIDHRDAAAFRELAQMHSGMVYATCRQITGNPLDAEDLTQECFEALARTRMGPRENVGAWLHGMATHKALNRNRAEFRRKRRETTYAETKSTRTDNPPAFAETEALLNEALAELPPKLSAPIVAHYLENQTHAEIAQALNVSRQTVTYRIGKSVRLLRRSLQQKGVTLGATAIASLLHAQRAEAASLERVATLTAAAQAQTAPLTPATYPWRHAAQSTFPFPAQLAAVATLALAAATIYWTVTRPETPPAEPPAPEPIAAAPAILPEPAPQQPAPPQLIPAPEPVTAHAEPTPIVYLQGYIGNDQGYPVPDAAITALPIEAVYGPYAEPVTTTANAQGEYQLNITSETPNATWLITVNAPGLAHASREFPIPPGELVHTLDFELAPGRPIHGRLLLPGGQPAVNANLILLAYAYDSGAHGLGGFQNAVTTGGDGHFYLAVHGAGQAAIRAVTPDGIEAFFPNTPAGLGDPLTLAMETPARLAGTITDFTGQPLPNAALQLRGAFHVESPITGEHDPAAFLWRTVLTDHEGRYDTGHLPPNQDYAARVTTPDERRPLSPNIHLGTLPSGESTRNLTLTRGHHFSGTVRAAATNEPLRHVHVRYAPKHAPAGAPHWAEVAEDGSFTLHLFDPVPHLVWAEYSHGTPPYIRNTFAQPIHVKPGQHPADITLALPDPVALTVQAVDISGAPIENAEAELWTQLAGEPARKLTLEQPLRTGPDGRVTWSSFPPDTEAWIQLTKPGRVSAQSQRIVGHTGLAYQSAPVTLYESGGIEGNVVTPGGQPLAGAALVLRMTFEGLEIRNRGFSPEGLTIATRTNPDGTFAIAHGLPNVPGDVTLTVHPPGGVHHLAVINSFTATPGHLTRVGTIPCAPESNPLP